MKASFRPFEDPVHNCLRDPAKYCLCSNLPTISGDYSASCRSGQPGSEQQPPRTCKFLKSSVFVGLRHREYIGLRSNYLGLGFCVQGFRIGVSDQIHTPSVRLRLMV